ncbi:DegT/DnrJ/EryC1/StrS family aminotransferase [Candidatus Parabeggiatoa sp. HSG14]|uniref:DegT/DnrJ/EryC1/StrS family aminotransferase n=1 Tax=Candidatus Parabeggiatoa sp. HSG14 TaxID=3055593 RepID=UPI0025A908C7|nr:DegT/DnrJ/EryC1/StrS family aminotransferase [Thiotrichales bacterium HSG14]
MLNIVLDNDVVLDLLSLSKNDTQHTFARLQKSPIHFWVSCCVSSLLETQINTAHHKPLTALFDGNNVQWLSSLAAHWSEIPANCPNKIQALMSLDAATLPGMTIIWSNNLDFTSVLPDIEWGDHEFVYGMLAQYEDETSFADLTSQQLLQRPMLEKYLFNVLKHGQYVGGPEIEELESELAAYVDAKHCVTVASGTDALLVALMAIGVKHGDEIITSPFNFIASAEMIALLGAKPVFADIDPNTYTLNPFLLKSATKFKTKAIVAANVFGQCADFFAINKIANQYDLPVIEDATQSFGASYHNRKSGILSAISCTSFYPSQPLGAYGEAGACFTNDDVLANMMRQIRHHGQNKRYHHQHIGISSRLNTIQASLLLAKLKHFPEDLEARLQVAETYNRLLEGHVKTPVVVSHNTSVYSQYTIEVNHRNEVQQQLQKQGITTMIHYPIPIHLQPVFASFDQSEGSFPVAEAVARRVLSLPIHSYLSEEKQTEIVDALISVL